MTLSRGVELPLLEDDGSPFGVAVPDSAGVPVVGRRLEMMPVLVFWNVRVGVVDSVSSCNRELCERRRRVLWNRTDRVAVIDFNFDTASSSCEYAIYMN